MCLQIIENLESWNRNEDTCQSKNLMLTHVFIPLLALTDKVISFIIIVSTQLYVHCISGCKRVKSLSLGPVAPIPFPYYYILKIWFVHQIYLWLCCSLIHVHRFIATTLFHISNPHFIGLTNKLDYVQGIGADVLVLSSIYQQSPQGQDLGQEIVNFTNVDKRLGTLEDFDALMTKAEEKGRIKCCLRLYYFDDCLSILQQ